jgi:DNA-binding transcriptional ArsR family regulator
MTEEADLAHIGVLLGDRTRAAILLTLLNGEAEPASVLADAAGASRSLASAHLRKLTEGGLITVTKDGRRRLYRLASAQVAEMLEAMEAIAPGQPVSSLRQANRNAQLRVARLCYDHLAGVFGVSVTEALVARGALRAGSFELTADGEGLMADLDVNVAQLRSSRRPLTRTCTDFTERREHVAGALGSAIAGAMLERGWVVRRTGTRALRVPDDGRRAAEAWLGAELAA